LAQAFQEAASILPKEEAARSVSAGGRAAMGDPVLMS
jgi:hypothetical protein